MFSPNDILDRFLYKQRKFISDDDAHDLFTQSKCQPSFYLNALFANLLCFDV